MTGTENNNIGNFRVLTILSLLSACGSVVFFVAPLLVGGFVTQLQFSSQQAGYIISSELAGFALAPIPAAIWVKKISWRKTLYIAAGSVILMNLITGSLTSFTPYLVTRFTSGLAAGIQLAVCMAVIHRTRDPDRSLGYWFSLQLLLGSVGLIFLPKLAAAFGIGAIFILLAIFHALLLMFIRFTPDRGESEETPEVKAEGSVYVWAALGFSAIFLFGFAIMGRLDLLRTHREYGGHCNPDHCILVIGRCLFRFRRFLGGGIAVHPIQPRHPGCDRHRPGGPQHCRIAYRLRCRHLYPERLPVRVCLVFHPALFNGLYRQRG